MSAAPIFRLFSPAAAGVSRTTVRHGHIWSRKRTPHPELSNFPPGHGEQIWVWNHVLTNQIIYSHSKVLDSNHAMKQLPFIAKKSKPAKLRRDLWRPMALIQFPKGAGTAGQSAFQKLREYRRRHELEWTDELFFEEQEAKYVAPERKTQTGGEQQPTKKIRTRIERGFAIHDQRANAVADMAAVLGGAGRGSRLWVSSKEKELLEKNEGAENTIDLRGKRWSAAAPKEGDADRGLIQATVFWNNAGDRNYASSWSQNVTHQLLEEGEQQGASQLGDVVESDVIQAELTSGKA